jgi:hypothetical protein
MQSTLGSRPLVLLIPGQSLCYRSCIKQSRPTEEFHELIDFFENYLKYQKLRQKAYLQHSHYYLNKPVSILLIRTCLEASRLADPTIRGRGMKYKPIYSAQRGIEQGTPNADA